MVAMLVYGMRGLDCHSSADRAGDENCEKGKAADQDVDGCTQTTAEENACKSAQGCDEEDSGCDAVEDEGRFLRHS